MDTQLKRGVLDALVLSTLLKADSYGYQIIKDISPYVDVSESTLYPILRRLEGSGMLTVRSAEHNGRLRKYYRITPAGLGRLSDFAEEAKQIRSICDYIMEEGHSGDET